MTTDDRPDLVTLALLLDHGITRADVRCRCPWAVEYGPAHAPYWTAEDLAPLWTEKQGGNEP